MKRHTTLGILLSIVLLMTLSIGTGRSQSGEGDGETGPTAPDEATAQISPVMGYQGRLTENGAPVTGERVMYFRLFNAETLGSLVWVEGPNSIWLSNGLFSIVIGETVPLPIDSMDQMLWLEIQVGDTILPRQKLTGAPYAFSLVPGADITGNVTGSVLHVENTGAYSGILAESSTASAVSGVSGSGHGVYAYSNGTTYTGAALWAENTDGIAMWGKNNSIDAALVVQNSGTGDLFKGFGGDGGEDELRILNDGAIATKADTYLFVPGTEALVAATTVGVNLDYQGFGAVLIDPGASGWVDIVFGATLPGILYGQPVEVEQVTVFYRSSATSSYIDNTKVYRQTISGSSLWPIVMAEDNIDHNSTAYTSYSYDVTSGNVLSQEEGVVSVQLRLQFGSGSDDIQIGGIRIRLGHHPLY